MSLFLPQRTFGEIGVSVYPACVRYKRGHSPYFHTVTLRSLDNPMRDKCRIPVKITYTITHILVPRKLCYQGAFTVDDIFVIMLFYGPEAFHGTSTLHCTIPL